MKKYIIYTLFSIIFITNIAYGDTIILVPNDKPTIQEAINFAIDGDTILVGDGIYRGLNNRNLDFKGKKIIIQSINGPDTTIIDCEENGRGFCFYSAEDFDSVLDGFTITNGYADIRGGGIYCVNSSPTIINCVISENFAGSDIINSIGDGGGIFCDNSSPKIMNCQIIDNNVGNDAAGIHCYNYSSPLIMNCLIAGNHSLDDGGGIDCSKYSNPIIVNSIICWNSAWDGGGGIVCYEYCNPMIINCVISNNNAYRGGGIYREYIGAPLVTNCILWDNEATYGREIALCNNYASSSLTISNSDVKDGQSGVYIESGCVLNWGNGNIELNPMFIDQENNYFRPMKDSPCIDAGDNTAIPVEVTIDFEGNPRIVNNIVDIGAYEYFNLPPSAEAGPDKSVIAGELVIFDGSGSFDLDSEIVSYEWDFGDNSTGAGVIDTHVYMIPGVYEVTLTVIDAYGEKDADTLAVIVGKSIIDATIDFDPDTLNKQSGGEWCTVYIELPDGYDVREIEVNSILLNGEVSAVTDYKFGFVKSESSYIVDHDNDGILERMVKFDRESVQDILEVGNEILITVTGEVKYDNDLVAFEGYDTISVIENGKGKEKLESLRNGKGR